VRILFDLRGVGLGNNGGSFTLVKSANTLQELGHEVYMIDSGKNQHTWNKLETPHIIARNINKVPDADAIIATGYKSVQPTSKAPKRCGKKFHWIRGWELWQGSEKWIVDNVLQAPTNKIVNSICLQKKLKSFGVKSSIIRPGHDFNNFYPTEERDIYTLILGGLYHTKHNTKRSDWAIRVAELLKKEYPIKLYMFGTNKNPNNPIIDKYLCQPDIDEKNCFFNEITIFMSPSYLEGLHIVPQEVMLTKCPVVTTDAEMSGTQDYIKHAKNGYVAHNNFKSFLSYVEYLCKVPELRKRMGEKSRQTILNMGDRKDNMKKMARLLEK